ncbi:MULTISPECIES: trans-aconitate 2-methyltransferase [unclassified Rhodococcus (in: high G+C Gram-positive bacteria)]|uniref:class I SAM-dependent methyltransferase n=1 Tax=unclassified Rhodococcus (in: high G+C Gram-positive bacteria) TaxID=192944 RepID=UPI0016395112|nr:MULTISPECIES: methyltransferase domain-containing protein [unclassified Rhodococcus (in: high G+C Gram-positive bacteria)]MBC2638334.1 class I SAM-dependent methyltransferase [Rhodococcus sp. 3A]MBC2896925.1 class I SAM-dependent methyltransferase [Rhodococcus sp. 4CII]
MAQHSHHHTAHAHHHGPAWAELLDLDAEVLGSYLQPLTEWAGQHTREIPRRIVDVGAGTGVGTLTLARRFPTAEVIAIDRSEFMLERVRTAALARGLADRVSVVQADLDVAWPAVDAGDVMWAASSLHEVTDPDRVLRDMYGALNPGGLLIVVEMDTLPSLLPDDLGVGRPGLESRCHDALARMNWNSHPNWRSHLEHAGFEIVEERTFVSDATPAPPSTGRYAHAHLCRVRSTLDGQLAADDLSTLDLLLSDDDPQSVLLRTDLVPRGNRTAWAARRP